MQDLNSLIKGDPFEPIVFKLRVPIRSGEVEYQKLTLKPPLVGDALMTDGHPEGSVAYALALLSSLSGAPLAVLKKIVPEDWADLVIILSFTNLRFTGGINLLDKKGEDGPEDPTEAAEGTPPPSLGTISAA